MTKYLSKKEVCVMLGISLRTLERWVDARMIPYHKMPTGTVRFSEEKLQAWLRSREVQPAPRLGYGRYLNP
jgi:excisionase family DNA binding protein